MSKTYELGALVAPHPDGRRRYLFAFSYRLNDYLNETMAAMRSGRASAIVRAFEGCGKLGKEGPYTGFGDRGALAKNPSAALGIRLHRIHGEGSVICNPKVKEYFDHLPPPSAGPIPLDWVADLGARKDLEARLNRQVALVGKQQDPMRKAARTRVVTEETIVWVAQDNPYRESLLDPLSSDNDLEYYEELARLWEGERKWERDLAAGKHIRLGPTAGGAPVRQETTTPAHSTEFDGDGMHALVRGLEARATDTTLTPLPEIIRVDTPPRASPAQQERCVEWTTDAFIADVSHFD